MDLKSNLQLLAEAAAGDIQVRTEANQTFEMIREAYSRIPEAPEIVVTEASDVVITETFENEYYVEMVNLAPFMLDSGIRDIAEALDMVAAANGIAPKQLGLCIESQTTIDAYLEAARKKTKQTGDPKHLKKAAAKVDKNNKIAANLMKKGYKVVRKKSVSKVCPKCGKAVGKCKCEGVILGESPESIQEARAVKAKAKKKVSGKTPTRGTKKAVNDNRKKGSPVKQASRRRKVCPECGMPVEECECGRGSHSELAGVGVPQYQNQAGGTGYPWRY